MIILTEFERIYLEIKLIIKKFKKRNYFSLFSSSDIFLTYFSKNHTYLSTFMDTFYGDSYGVQVFFNHAGFNYVHDIFTTNDDVINVGDCDSLVSVFTPKDELDDEMKKFLKNHNRRISNENLFIYRFQPGYGKRFASVKEMQTVLENLLFLSSLIENDMSDITEAVKNEKAVISYVNKEKFEYFVKYDNLPLLEHMPSKGPINIDFYNEFKDMVYVNEECYLFSSYVPLVIKETNVRPLMVYFLMPNSGKVLFRFISDSPKDYKSCIYGILDEIFTMFNKPVKMFLNNRKIYSIIARTMNELKIEIDFLRENPSADKELGEIIGKIYDKTSDGYIENVEAMNLLMELITDTLNSIEDDDLDLDEDEEEKEENYVS